MAPLQARDSDSKSRGYSFELPLEQEREVERLMEVLPLWSNKRALLLEAVSEKVARGWATVAARDAAERALHEERPSGIHEAARRDRR